jgi:hypothetical protein
MSPRSVTLRWKSAVRKAAWAASEARSGARRRSTSLAIIVVAIRRIAADVPPPRGRTRRRPTTASPTRSSWVSTPSASRISERSSAVERAATASTELERSISTSDASSARDAARTTSGSPRPDSTASDIALSAPRSGSAASLRAGEDTD